jgi:S1-C subfamily serine protease
MTKIAPCDGRHLAVTQHSRRSAASCLAIAVLIPAMAVFATATLESTVARAAVPLDVVEQIAGVPTLAPVLKRVTPAVVNIEIKVRAAPEAAPAKLRTKIRRSPNVPETAAQREIASAGSGVVFDARKGLIVTNNHVIANADQILVILTDGRELRAWLVGTDPATDVAII